MRMNLILYLTWAAPTRAESPPSTDHEAVGAVEGGVSRLWQTGSSGFGSSAQGYRLFQLKNREIVIHSIAVKEGG